MTANDFHARRKALGTQVHVAAALGYGAGGDVHLSRMEKGVRGVPRWIALAIRALEEHPELMDPDHAA